MLTRQIKVKLHRGVDEVVTRLARRDSGAKSSLIRRIALAAARRWDRNGLPPLSSDMYADPVGPLSRSNVVVRVWFSEADVNLISRMAESECVTVAQCVRLLVAVYVHKLTANPAR